MVFISLNHKHLDEIMQKNSVNLIFYISYVNIDEKVVKDDSKRFVVYQLSETSTQVKQNHLKIYKYVKNNSSLFPIIIAKSYTLSYLCLRELKCLPKLRLYA